MTAERVVSLTHTELVEAVRGAMADQLRRDGRLQPDMELGLLFYADSPDDVHVVGQVRRGARILFELKGRKPQLSAIATQLALSRLPAAERKGLVPSAEVAWRAVRFTADEEQLDRFLADVTFRKRA